ncbi:WXG100 family type VII secretion target [Mycobacterium sp. LTG2003]
MTVTIPTILDSRPAGLIDAAQLAQQQAQLAVDQLDQGRNALADMRKGWDSGASDAASASAERTFASHRKIVDALHDMKAALQRGGDQMSATRADVAETVGKIQPFGFQVADDGTVSIAPGSQADEMASRSPVLARQMQMLAMQYSIDLKQLIAEFDTQDNALANALQQATGDLDLKEIARMGPGEQAGKPSPDDSQKDGTPPAEPGKDSGQTTPGATPTAVPPVPPVVPGPANSQAAPRPAAATPPSKPGVTPAQPRTAEPARPSAPAPAPPPAKGPVPAQAIPTQPARQSGPVPTAPPTTPGTPAQGSGSTATAATPASYSAAQTSSSSGAPESNIQAVSSVVGDIPEGVKYRLGDDGWIYPDLDAVNDDFDEDDDDW